MALDFPFTAGQTLAKEPIDEQLMDQNIRQNLEGLDVRIDALEAGSGSGGGASSGVLGEIITGGETNVGEDWKKRYSFAQNVLKPSKNGSPGTDLTCEDKEELLKFMQSNDSGWTINLGANYYKGQALRIAKDSTISFIIKKGVNKFTIGNYMSTVETDGVEVLIDGNSVTATGLYDENGDLRSDTYSNLASGEFYQVPQFFMGLDGEEHLITIKNSDSGSDRLSLEYIEVGYTTPNPSINEDIKISAGKALVRGVTSSFDEATLRFGKTNKNGHTGSIVLDNANNTLSVLDGESPAMTQIKPEEAIAFSGAVTTLPVKNSWYFPANGICLLSTPWGAHHTFSYGSKDETSIQSHSLDDVLWSSKPSEDITPLDNMESSTLAASTGDLNINYIGTAPITISSSNNKLDFKVTKNGVETTHVATIANGNYSADLLPLGRAINDAMQAVASIDGAYEVTYNNESQLWSIYAKAPEVTDLSLDFSSGPSFANSIHGTIGFNDTDLSGSCSYVANTEVQHLCARAIYAEDAYITSSDPRVKRSKASSNIQYSEKVDLEERLGVSNIYTAASEVLLQITPDENCSGLRLDFLQFEDGVMVAVQIDEGQMIYLTQQDKAYATSDRGSAVSGLITFPRGARKISVLAMFGDNWEIDNHTERIAFVGCQQYFTKPAWEKLKTTQAIISEAYVSPLSLYKHTYGNNSGALFSPTVNSKINTITETGSWSASTDNTLFNRARRLTSTQNDYVDINFDVSVDGGGFFLKFKIDTTGSRKVGAFLSTAAINESTDRIQNTHFRWGTAYYDQDCLQLTGLPAATYNLRVKKEDLGNNTWIAAYGVIDGDHAEENKNTITDLSQVGAGVIYPVNVRRSLVAQDTAEMTPAYLFGSGYKEGIVSKSNYKMRSPSFGNTEDNTFLVTASDRYYGQTTEENIGGVEFYFSGFAKSVTSSDEFTSTRQTVVTASVDGLQLANTYSQRAQVKGGVAPSSTRGSQTRGWQKLFKLSCAHSAGETFTCADTRGLQVGRQVILNDGTNTELAIIASFVVNTSFTVEKAPLVVVAANVTEFDFSGYHSVVLNSGGVDSITVCCFEYEPLTLERCDYRERMSQDKKYEKVKRVNYTVANGDALFFPVHSDGTEGSWSTSSYEIVGINGTVTAYDLLSNPRSVSVTGGGTLKVIVTSEKLVNTEV